MAAHTSRRRAKLYVILGSHACRAAILMLEHKRLEFDAVELPSGLHPVLVRLLGFRPDGAGRRIDDRRHVMLGLVDRLGTVPALLLDGRRVMTNRRIARLLDEVRPEPSLFPADPSLRARVEEVERWGDEIFQMAARRTILSATAGRHLVSDGGEGRLGALLFRNDLVRYGASCTFGLTFAAGARAEVPLLSGVGGMFDTIDSWIEEGLLDGQELNAADFVIAPSIALLDYHRELRDEIAARPLGGMLERILPRERSADVEHAAAAGQQRAVEH
jgi:hypothetical protein